MVPILVAVGLVACRQRVNVDTRVARPAFSDGPVLLFDAGHNNRHAIGDTYRTFAELIRHDGVRIEEVKGTFTAELLARGRMLAVVCAKSKSDTSAESAFTAPEIAAVTQWVRGGGALLLVVDHYPFPNAAESLLNALGLEPAKGMTFDPANCRAPDDSRIVFRRDNGLLASHPITNGRDESETVNVVETFTGDAVKPRSAEITPLLKLGPQAVNRVGRPVVSKQGSTTRTEVQFGEPRAAKGYAQCAAFELGQGRVVVGAEAAMWTAQLNGDRPIGMNAPGNDDRQFVLNAVRWLGRVL